MDPCLGYLREIDILMESYEELPLYEDIFEAADPEVGAKTAKNAEIEANVKNMFSKAIDAIKHIFERIGEIIKTIFTWMGMDSDEKTKYKEFVEECKRNPEFAKMKVTLHDYRQINEEYNKLLEREEKKYRSFKEEEVDSKPNIIKDIEEGLAKIAKKAAGITAAEASSFSIEAALTYASACRENAAKVQMMINHDMGLLAELEKELGKGQIKKFKRKVRWLQSRHEWIRRIAGGRQKQTTTIREALKETITNVNNVLSIHRRAKKGKHGEDIKDVEKAVGTSVADVGVAAGKRVAKDTYYSRKAYNEQMKSEKSAIKTAEREARKENKERDKK